MRAAASEGLVRGWWGGVVREGEARGRPHLVLPQRPALPVPRPALARRASVRLARHGSHAQAGNEGDVSRAVRCGCD